ncbi:hypothetical protein GKZ90_0006265 [Flavobacterium sp. MC2016-06]|jgi:hypothetical protein|uniref:lipase family protein n=1 Tax=Flavobacterium sp. MC2016-06 TaxID=2676308 RepID=UPI0012BA5792|nr:hypothetical protein [Flavobacterium sp. MC2016-06]MBU3857743.1 hypothetical protein [Flavobacterium sp. MC2016-06]
MKDSDTSLQVLMVQLASQAVLPTLVTSGPQLPTGWVRLTTFSSRALGTVVPVQGFLSVGPFNEDGDLSVALSLGITWNGFSQNNLLGFPVPGIDLRALPSRVIGKNARPSDIRPMVLSVFADAYINAQNVIWESLTFIKDEYSDLPFYITGMGLGAPIAQICSLDFKSGNVGPNKQDPPAQLAEGYTFSTPAFTNIEFQAFYNSLITNKNMPAQYAISAATPSIRADFFPLNDGYFALGAIQYISNLVLPKYDVPWWNRSDVYYLKQLGGEPINNLAIPVSFSNLPNGFSQNMAFVLSLLTAATYQLAQHPESLIKLNIAPYTPYKTIGDGTSFATIFQSLDSVVVAFRGTISFKEYYTYNCQSIFANVSFIEDPGAVVHAGTEAIYNLPINNSTTTLSAALIAELKTIAPGKKLYITGHDIGGAVASLAAMDYAMSKYGFDVTALYTFGSTLFSNIIFRNYFNDEVGAYSYQLLRLNDRLSNAIERLGYFSLANQITVNGRLEIEESTFHSLAGYINLLNPSGSSSISQKDSDSESL